MNGTKRKWVAYGVAGAVGLVMIGGGAAATAANMNLRTTEGEVVPGGAVTGPSGSVLDRASVTMTATDTSASVVSSASPTATPSAPSPASPATPASAPSTPQPVTAVSAATPVPAPAPAPAPAPESAASAGSVVSAGSD